MPVFRHHYFAHFEKLLMLSGTNRDLLYIRQSVATPFFENYAKLYFDAKYLENRFYRSW